ncbi:glycerol dehydratase reactivase beta/small subunit family protein [uncultured Ilyobacter sp.]|uniref:glycerol dehydratase reactivase beta/small subunit family protein n=1 Tax=uncultured Ilyobacter sp. TaxID=544433 RepID=UPI0029C83CF2|nr:glycerol dehydratase reactivase beta/small subunit family protein [uncultured Ilyobacter sp.]
MYTRPSINICCSESIDRECINEILWGIEEEGLPYFLKFVPSQEVVKGNYVSGTLEVGIGISENGDALLTTRKYDKKYIQKANVFEGKEKLRDLGSNGARLVKGLPLR